MAGITTPVAGTPISVSGFGAPTAEILNGFISSVRTNATANLTLSGSEQDVPGAAVSITVKGANAYAIVTAVFNCDAPTAPSTQSISKGRLNVDGVTRSDGEAQATHYASTGGAFTPAMSWKVLLTANVAHTIKLVALRTGSGGQVITGTGTNITALVFDIP